MHNHATRLNKLEESIGPAPKPLRALILFGGPGERVVSVIASGDDKTPQTQFDCEPGETAEALCQRARRAMGWPEK